jgi:hypothetical protein
MIESGYIATLQIRKLLIKMRNIVCTYLVRHIEEIL